ncbi:MAG TPA: glycerol-3-phosphate acyltransferase [Terriglobia bacterium]|nr:glycerol-3-phosphate acyltransferase [Terriglobia bacterium]
MMPTFAATAPIIIRLLVCFLIGSIPFAVLAMLGSGIDIRRVGSGNPGFNNVLRVSKPRAIVALIGDMGKGILAVWLFHKTGDSVTVDWLYGFAAVLGHCYSPFLKFNGGKGIATSGGVMLVFFPKLAALALLVFAVIRVTGGRLKWREAGTIASLSTWLIFALVIFFFIGPRQGLYAGLMTLILALRHKRNFKNLFSQPNHPKQVVASEGRSSAL